MIREIPNAKAFVRVKMQEIDKQIYNDIEINNFFSLEHKIIGYVNADGKVIAFCGILVLEDGYKMCYSWCNSSTSEGKRAYSKGIDYVVARYNPMFFSKGALKFKKIRRIVTWIDQH